MNQSPPNNPAQQNNSSLDPKMALMFPDMKPIKFMPFLGRINGFGFSLVGKRDFNEQTGTYLKSHVITLLFIPIFSLGAYRVADAENGGWYFIGKEKISSTASILNKLLIVLLMVKIGGVYWNIRVNSSEYKSQQLVEKAKNLLETQKINEAARYYIQAYSIHPSDNVIDGFKNTINKGLKSEDPSIVANITVLLIDSKLWPKVRNEYVNLYEQSLSKAESYAETHSNEALKILSAATKVAGNDTRWIPLRTTLLEKVLNSNENLNHNLAEELCRIYLANGDHLKVITLLAPHSESFQGKELAGMLGSAYVYQDDLEASIPLLEGYLKTHQKAWLDSYKKLNEVIDARYTRAMNSLNNNEAPPYFYHKYDAANEEEQNRMVDEYYYSYLEKDAFYLATRKKIEKYNDVPSYIMDLGIAYLRLAQISPTDRQQNLEKAEKTLLSLQSHSGESFEYKLFLGQVYYWLGKPTEGKELFDSLLEDSERSYQVVYLLAQKLREIGIADESKTLSEEAYEKGVTLAEKTEAASIRALLSKDIEETISWYEKCDKSLPYVVVALNGAKARLAWENNDKPLALKYYKETLAGYEKQLESAVTFNNAALVHFEMFNISGEISHYNEGLQKLEKAIELAPNNSIQCMNNSSIFFTAAYQDILKDKLEPRMLQYGVGVYTLRYFYNNQREKDALFTKVLAHPYYKKACALYRRALLLSPQNKGLYLTGISQFSATQDKEMILFIADKVKESGVNLAGNEQEWKEAVENNNLENDVSSMKSNLNYNEQVITEMTTPLSIAIINSYIESAELYLWDVAPIIDIAAKIENMEVLYNTHPSTAMASSYNELLMVDAATKLQASEPEFKKWTQDAKGQVSANDLVLLWLKKFGNPEDVFKKYPSVKKALVADSELNKKHPKSSSVNDWLIAKYLAEESTDGIALKIKEGYINQITTDISAQFTPYTPSTVILKMNMMLLDGKVEEAKAYYIEERKKCEYLPQLFF